MPAFERRRWSVRSGALHALRVLLDEGPRGLLDHGFSYLGVHRLVVLQQRLDSHASAEKRARPPTLPGVMLGEADEADLEALSELRAAEHAEVSAALGRPKEPVQALFTRMFAQGDRCFVARVGRRIVAVLWITRGVVPVRYLWCDLLLAPDDAYVYDVFVAPDARGRGLATALYRHLAGVLAVEGRSRAVMLVRVHNAANLRAARRAGYRYLGVLSCIAVGGRALHRGHALRTRPWPAG